MRRSTVFVAIAAAVDSPDWLVWTARDGRGPFGEPKRQAYGSYWFNARAREDGKLDPVS